MKRINIALLSVILAITITSCLDEHEFKERPTVDPPAPTEHFASGADISGVTEFEAKGVKFYNKAGEERECTALMKELGMNAIRLRVFVDHALDLCEKEDVLVKAKRVQALGMRLMIDFHYSDDFADPGTQDIPAAWIDYDLNQMKQAVEDHTVDVLSTLKENGIDVEWVQVGNETTGGMLWPMGNVDKNMGNYAVLTQAGYDAVKSVYPDAQVIVHLDRGNLLDIYTRIFNGLKLNNTKWDIIGMSFYPDAGDWQKQTDALTDNIITLSEKYGTPCMVVETGMLRNDPGTAREYFEYLFDKMMNDTKGYCRGILYWEPETYRESGYDKGAFSDDGKPTEALEPFNMSQYE
ncbi:glycosyl hydrolase 53 family protein [Bacteroides ovatus]|uniref:glycosyl hydrolase 53 family protein n=1 Tax=Bacteroides ovatus TaxID=28116 RepID=UPI0022E4D121|nr:glycosyl hydrolase 53 family protein [Bacteroides ovatus]